MRVLVLGASGFVGFETAKAISRAGHIVLGQTRSPEKALLLAAEEIIPIVKDTTQISTWLDEISSVDIIVDAVGGDYATGCPQRLKDVNAFAERARPSHQLPPHPLTYISISGIWLHGESWAQKKTEGDLLQEPVDMLDWRPAVDKAHVSLRSSSYSGIVIRSGIVYGKSGSLLQVLFESANKGTISWWGGPEKFSAFIHVEDLASFVALVVSNAPMFGGLTLDAAPYNDSWFAITSELQRISGATCIEWLEPSNPFEAALATSQLLGPTLGRDLLGWSPKKSRLSEGMLVYYNAFLAAKRGK